MLQKVKKSTSNVVFNLFRASYKSGTNVAQYKGSMEVKMKLKQILKEEPKMKKLITGMALMVAVVGISLFGTPNEAKADSRTLHGVADIIFATGALVNGGYNTTVYYDYDPHPVYYERHYYPVRRYHHRSYYHPRRYYHCY